MLGMHCLACPLPDDAVVLHAGCSRGAARLFHMVLSRPVPAPCPAAVAPRCPTCPEVWQRPERAAHIPTGKKGISLCTFFGRWTRRGELGSVVLLPASMTV